MNAGAPVPRIHRALGVALVAWAMATTPAAGQDQDGPVVVSQREALTWFQFTDLDIAFDTFWRRSVDELDADEELRDREDRFEQNLEIETAGFIGHPNLLEIDLLGSIGLRQEFYDIEAGPQVSDTNRFLWRYDVSGLFLKESRLPILVYSRRDDRTIDREFAGSQDNRITETGVRLQYRSDVAPSSLVYFHRDQDQSGGGFDDFSLTEDTVELLSQVNLGQDHRLDVDYRFDHIQQGGDVRLNQNFDRHDGTITQHLDFGEGRRHRQRAELRLFKETGDFAVDRLRFTESLRLRHTRAFETKYDYNIDYQDRTESRQTFQIGTVGFTHRLFESLLTNGDVGLSRLDLSDDDFTSDEVFTRITTDYTKRVPLGQVAAGLGLGYSHRNESDRGSTIQITDEQRSFGPSGIIIINRRDVVPNSLRITNITGTITYDEGFDYVARYELDRTEVRRIITGNIQTGQPLLFDYRIGPEPGGTTDTTDFAAKFRYEIEEGLLLGLAFRLEYRDQNQDRDPEDPFLAPENDFTDLKYGVDYQRGPVWLRLERQERDANISPFDRNRVEARFTQGLGRGSALLLKADYDELRFRDTGEHAEILVLTGQWRQRITDQLDGSLRVIWRDEEISDGIDTHGWDVRLDLNWEYRQTSVYASARVAQLDSDIQDTLSQTFIVGFRREF